MTDLPEPRKAQAGSQGLWLSLLVLDSIFVIVFGGAVAAKAYQSWKTPAFAAAAALRRRPVPKAAQTAKASEAAPMPKPPAPASPAETPVAKPEPRISRRADEPRPPKPSLLNEPPGPRSTPFLATSGVTAAAPAVPAAAPSAPAKARPVVFKLRANAGAVQLVGAFIVHGGRKDMTKSSDGIWSVKLYLNPGQYRYFFSVDNKKTLDPKNPASDRGTSLLTVP